VILAGTSTFFTPGSPIESEFPKNDLKEYDSLLSRPILNHKRN
ncbi:3917_t:CDS:2, partial [Acaulospora morrowiae]